MKVGKVLPAFCRKYCLPKEVSYVSINYEKKTVRFIRILRGKAVRALRNQTERMRVKA